MRKDSRSIKVGKRKIAHNRYVFGSNSSSDTGGNRKWRRLIGCSQRSVLFQGRYAPVLAETQQRRSFLVAFLGAFLFIIFFIISLPPLYYSIDVSRPYRFKSGFDILGSLEKRPDSFARSG